LPDKLAWAVGIVLQDIGIFEDSCDSSYAVWSECESWSLQLFEEPDLIAIRARCEHPWIGILHTGWLIDHRDLHLIDRTQIELLEPMCL
jgi:hypothetical protein